MAVCLIWAASVPLFLHVEEACKVPAQLSMVLPMKTCQTDLLLRQYRVVGRLCHISNRYPLRPHNEILHTYPVIDEQPCKVAVIL